MSESALRNWYTLMEGGLFECLTLLGAYAACCLLPGVERTTRLLCSINPTGISVTRRPDQRENRPSCLRLHPSPCSNVHSVFEIVDMWIPCYTETNFRYKQYRLQMYPVMLQIGVDLSSS